MSDQNNTTSIGPDVEEFRDIPDYPGYRVSNLGRVQSCLSSRGDTRDAWHDLKPCYVGGRGRGYLTVGLCRDHKPRLIAVHTLVLTAFLGPCPPGMQCRHFPDRDKANNRLSNLKWGTPKENADDRNVQGTAMIGERNHKAKLTEFDVLVIRELLANGVFQAELAETYGVSQVMVSRIGRRENWTHI